MAKELDGISTVEDSVSGQDTIMPVFEGQEAQPTPQGWDLLPPAQRRLVSFREEELIQEYRDTPRGKLPLFAVIDAAQKQLAIRYAVIDAVSTGYPAMGLCMLNDDFSYTRHSGGYIIFKKGLFDKHNPATAIVRIGELDPARAEMRTSKPRARS